MKENKAINTLLQSAKTAFGNALTRQDIVEKVSVFGYSQQRIQEGMNLCTETETKYQDQIRKRALYEEKTIKCAKDEKDARTKYRDFRRIAKLSLSGEELSGFRNSLLLTSPISTSLQGFLIMAKRTYEEAKRTDILQKLSSHGFSEDTLRQELNGLFDLESLDKEQEMSKGDSQRATRVRDDFVKVLRIAYKAFVESSKIALRDEPQQREVLGIVEYSVKKAKKEDGKDGKTGSGASVNYGENSEVSD